MGGDSTLRALLVPLGMKALARTAEMLQLGLCSFPDGPMRLVRVTEGAKMRYLADDTVANSFGQQLGVVPREYR